MNTTDNRDAFYASVRAIDALCPACKQPQNAPSCERREHWLPSDTIRPAVWDGYPSDTNDCLIAAAPALLATAKALLAVLDEHGIRKAAVEMRVPLYERAADLIDAIAKAEGRES